MNYQMLKLPLILTIIFLFAAAVSATNADRQAYVVYMGALPKLKSPEVLADHHHGLLANAVGDEEMARKAKIYSYGRSFNGFAARLLPHEVDKLAMVSVFRSKTRKLHTTRSWDFLGLSEAASRRNAAAESNVIVGLLDSGIWMEGPSFKDDGYGEIPSKWKGKCVTGHNFTSCNRKVIGARFFDIEEIDNSNNKSPVDEIGHGSHTASTIAGAFVDGASLYGVAGGKARGGVPAARIAMYKVCWAVGCSDVDLLAGFDHAIADGVDIISVSIGGESMEFFNDPIAIGSFHAMEKGILTSCSAGNSGPDLKTVENTAPWIMTVAASTIDRDFSTVVKLGNNKKLSGVSVNTFTPKKQMYPLISGSNAALPNQSSDLDLYPSWCDYGSLDEKKVKGKIVYCLGSIDQEYTISDLGGVGVISNLLNITEMAITTPIPSTHLSSTNSDYVEAYINSTKNPKAVIYKTTTRKVDAPFLAYFSSKGPQTIALNILKPDIAAPGVNILAAYSNLASIPDNRHSLFNLLSGTSMACPHAAAAAAYLKAFHPTWSPAALKSALMTTATPLKIGDELDVIGAGAGQINPTKAVHPGLIYDLSRTSYLSFLCTNKRYSDSALAILTGDASLNCSDVPQASGSDAINYPSMYVPVDRDATSVSAVFHRTVTHVGFGPSTYKAKIKSPAGLSVKVSPETLKFDRAYKKLSFKVVVKGAAPAVGQAPLTASLEWDDSKHYVRSPILVFKV
ncbi:subtilisin-like protease SBT4.14 [Cucumis melo var. makuwa]|uniref:Subtilisin-like protease SBT4.14 n=1 Tax=Cucumis melo var. makuwa TaxID=1194695 RepID=A0A5D3DPI9_CUCMM|nr:subtilisin-like protease SBT4.14 [Cucumis melo var. makuwa]